MKVNISIDNLFGGGYSLCMDSFESKSLLDNGKDVKIFGDRVLLRPVMESTMSESGLLYLPCNEDKRTFEADVLLVGDKVKIGVKVGDRVIYEGKAIKMSGGKTGDRTPGIKIDDSSDFVIDAKYISCVIES